MSCPRPRFLRPIVGACVAAAASFVIAIPTGDARDGRSKTRAFGIEELASPTRHGSDHIIVDIAPLHPLQGGAVARTAQPAPFPALVPDAKPVREPAVASSPKVAPPPAVAAPTPAVAPPSPALALPATPIETEPKPAAATVVVAEPTPTVSTAGGGEPKAEADAIPSFDIKPRSDASILFETAEPATQAPSISLDVKPKFALVNEWAYGEYAPLAVSNEEFAEVLALRDSNGEAQRTQVTDERSTAASADGNARVEASPTDAASSRQASNAFASAHAARPSNRPAPLSGFAKEVSRISDSVPPVSLQAPKPANQAESKSDSVVARPSATTGGFDLQKIISAARSPAPGENTSGAEAKDSKPEPDAAASDADSEELKKAAKQAEEEKKTSLWQRVAKAQAAAKAKAIEQEQKEPEGERQSAIFRALKKLMKHPAATEEERAYTALLDEGVKGPIRVRIADRATFWLPMGYVYLDAEKARDAMDGEEGVWDDANQGLILPATRVPTWMAYVDLLDEGFVRDDDAKSLDPIGLLAGFKSGVAALNSERIRNGVGALTVTGWVRPPEYVATKHNLKSCVGAVDGASQEPDARLVNCFSYALGRRGAVKILVAGDEANLASFEGEAASLAEKITYDQGAAYGDIDQFADKPANYSVAALAGGAIGLKTIVNVVGAAGASKDQGLLLAKALKYWEEILTGLVVFVLGLRWFIASRSAAKEDEHDMRSTPGTPFWKIVVGEIRVSLRRMFETEAAPTRVAASAASTQGARSNARTENSEAKPVLATLREKLAAIQLFRKKPEEDPTKHAQETLRQEAESQADSVEEKAAVMHENAKRPSGLPGMLASIRLFRKTPTEAAPQAARGVAMRKDVKAQRGGEAATVAVADGDAKAPTGRALTKLASLMRKKAEEPAPMIDPARIAGRRVATVAEPTPVIEQAASTSAKVAPPPLETPAPAIEVDPFGLVEPGDAQAASLALSAREALQQAHG